MRYLLRLAEQLLAVDARPVASCRFRVGSGIARFLIKVSPKASGLSGLNTGCGFVSENHLLRSCQ